RLAGALRTYGEKYAGNAAHVLGRAYELEKKPADAKAAYEEHIKNVETTYEGDLRVRVARLNCLLENRDTLEAKLSDILKEADAAVKWSHDPSLYDPALRALARWTAASARATAADDPDLASEEKNNRQAAITHFREAIRQLPAHEPGYW